MNNPIYKPAGKALEYASYALNLYTGCPHRCTYCYVPAVMHKTKEDFHKNVFPRIGIVNAVLEQLERDQIVNETIHLCFSCDPYPAGVDTSVTREIIKAIKESGNHVQILTKNPTDRDFDLLDEDDWFGVTISCYEDEARFEEPNAMMSNKRIEFLIEAKFAGIKTWISAEPVIDPYIVFDFLEMKDLIDYDKIAIGKMNYQKSNIDWKWFAKSCKVLGDRNHVNYVLKEELKALLKEGSHA